MKKIIGLIILVLLVVFFWPKSYISSPGFVTQEANAEFERTKPECWGYSYLTNPEAMAADAPGKSLCFGWLVGGEQSTTQVANPDTATSTDQSTATSTTPVLIGAENACGFTVKSVKQGDAVKFPLTITGEVDNTKAQERGCNWIMFEGQAGVVQVFANYQNAWHQLGATVPLTVAEWTSLHTTFSATVNFNNAGLKLPDGTPLKLVFTEENASGLPPIDKVEMMVVLDQQ